MADRILVAFQGDGGGVDSLSWGQSEIWRSMTAVGDSFSLSGVVPVAAATTVDDVTAMLRFMMVRHQSLRTKIVVDSDGRPWQQVARSGHVPIDLVDADCDEPAAVAARILARYERTPFDHANEWPTRMAVVRCDGVPTHVVTAYSHVALDVHGLDALVADVLARDEPAGPVTAAQPLAQTRQQRTPSAQRQSDAALRHAERILRTAPASRFPESDDRREARWWQFGYHSPASLPASLAVAARNRVHTTPVLLAGFAVALCRVTGAGSAVARLMVSNRFRPGFATSVSPVAQSCLGVIEVGDNTFDQVVTSAWRALTKAGKHAYFDPDRMVDLVAAVGRDDVAIASFNDRRRASLYPTLDRMPTRTELDAARADAVPRWERRLTTYDHTLNLHINETAAGIDYQLCADTHHLSSVAMAALVHCVEDVIVTAALDPRNVLTTVDV